MTTITTTPRAETPPTGGYPAFLARISQDLLLSLPTFEYALSSLPPEPLVQAFLQSTRTLPSSVIPAKAGTCQSPTSPPNNNPTPPSSIECSPSPETPPAPDVIPAKAGTCQSPTPPPENNTPSPPPATREEDPRPGPPPPDASPDVIPAKAGTCQSPTPPPENNTPSPPLPEDPTPLFFLHPSTHTPQFPLYNHPDHPLPEGWICNFFHSSNPVEAHLCLQCPYINTLHVPFTN
ncbi:MAG: hypothetical protein LBU08_02410, partial [Tannerellaceae bacterium]|nr:hypothetical protein [Tannerellaceae bacterium]